MPVSKATRGNITANKFQIENTQYKWISAFLLLKDVPQESATIPQDVRTQYSQTVLLPTKTVTLYGVVEVFH